MVQIVEFLDFEFLDPGFGLVQPHCCGHQESKPVDEESLHLHSQPPSPHLTLSVSLSSY